MYAFAPLKSTYSICFKIKISFFFICLISFSILLYFRGQTKGVLLTVSDSECCSALNNKVFHYNLLAT